MEQSDRPAATMGTALPFDGASYPTRMGEAPPARASPAIGVTAMPRAMELRCETGTTALALIRDADGRLTQDRCCGLRPGTMYPAPAARAAILRGGVAEVR